MCLVHVHALLVSNKGFLKTFSYKLPKKNKHIQKITIIKKVKVKIDIRYLDYLSINF
jgi:hypothetical protein